MKYITVECRATSRVYSAVFDERLTHIGMLKGMLHREPALKPRSAGFCHRRSDGSWYIELRASESINDVYPGAGNPCPNDSISLP